MFHYLDNAATTQTRPEAAQAAVTAMTEEWGNPSSRYAFGQEASGRLKEHRAQVAAGLGCRPEEVYFLSCGTEGDNWAIAAAVEKNRRKGKHIITTAIEHAAVLEPIRELERQGYEVTWLQPDQQGIITAEQVEAALRPDTILVAMMLVNNELGTVLPVAETARAIRAARCPALLHCDAVQGFLKVPFTPEGLGVDTLAVSGHKVHAPKGIGALYIRRGAEAAAADPGGRTGGGTALRHGAHGPDRRLCRRGGGGAGQPGAGPGPHAGTEGLRRPHPAGAGAGAGADRGGDRPTHPPCHPARLQERGGAPLPQRQGGSMSPPAPPATRASPAMCTRP